MYGLDTQIDDRRIVQIGEAYERKIELFREFQLGHDLSRIKFAVRRQRKASFDTKDMIMEDPAGWGV